MWTTSLTSSHWTAWDLLEGTSRTTIDSCKRRTLEIAKSNKWSCRPQTLIIRLLTRSTRMTSMTYRWLLMIQLILLDLLSDAAAMAAARKSGRIGRNTLSSIGSTLIRIWLARLLCLRVCLTRNRIRRNKQCCSHLHTTRRDQVESTLPKW